MGVDFMNGPPDDDRPWADDVPGYPTATQSQERAQIAREQAAILPKPIYGAELAEPLPPIDWLCPGLRLTSGSHTIVAGNAYSGKSLAWADVQVAVATGGDAWGTYRCKRGRALMLDFDGQGQRISQERFQRIARARGVDLRELGDALGYLRRPGFYLDEPHAEDRLLRLLDGISLCVVDSWRGATPNTDEWKRGPVQLVADRLEAVSTKTGCVIIDIDHNVKPSRDGNSMRSSMHDVHGSTAKSETAQSHFVFTGEEGESLTHVAHKKERVQGHTLAPFAIRFDDVPRDRDPRWGLSVAHVDRAQLNGKTDEQAAREAANLREKVRVYIERNPGVAGADNVVSGMGGRAGPIRAAVKQLVAESIVKAVHGRGNSVRLYLAHMAPAEAA
ncbi:MAG TPA: AAA family ATPase [Polyangiaceae bacterium]|jgi:hypothetical protein|nr:AAA family ATPase [Polyangiaceae bacterium]